MNALFLTASLEPLALSGNIRMAAAILYGIALGIVLVKSGFFERSRVVDALKLQDLDIAKTLILALGIGVMLFSLLREANMVQQHIPNASYWGVLLGGVISGIGLGIGGLSPVTAVAALGAGRLYAFWVFLGMLLAVPAVQAVRSLLREQIDRFSAPMESSLEPTNGIFAANSPVLWIFGITLILTLILHLAGGKGASKGSDAPKSDKPKE